MDKIFSHMNAAEIKALHERLKKAADDEGLPFGERVMAFNSRRAQELGKWAETRGKGDEFHHAAFKTYLADGKNIAMIPVLLDVAGSVGLPKEEAEEALLKETFKKEVEADWSLALNNNITAAPTFVINSEKLVGAQPYDALVRFLEASGLKKRSGL